MDFCCLPSDLWSVPRAALCTVADRTLTLPGWHRCYLPCWTCWPWLWELKDDIVVLSAESQGAAIASLLGWRKKLLIKPWKGPCQRAGSGKIPAPEEGISGEWPRYVGRCYSWKACPGLGCVENVIHLGWGSWPTSVCGLLLFDSAGKPMQINVFNCIKLQKMLKTCHSDKHIKLGVYDK